MSKENKEIEVKELPIDFQEHASFIIKQQNVNILTHGFFKYPCKFIPEIPRWALKKYMPVNGKSVFDPFAGSGTTLLEAKIQGYDAYGTEIDPIAKKIIDVKTKDYSFEDMHIISDEYEKIIKMMSNNFDDIVPFFPDINNLHHWFNHENLLILGKLKTLISQIEDKNAKNFLEVVFISIIKPVSQADDSSPKPYVSKKVIKVAPNALEQFKKVYKRYFENLTNYFECNLLGNVSIVSGDALDTETKFQADIAITSPPYINAFDYARILRLENLWMETRTEKEILESKKIYVGTESFKINDEKNKSFSILEESELLNEKFKIIREIDEKRALIIKKFFDDMKLNLINVQNHLKSGSFYIIVIGNSTIRKEVIESWKIIREIAEHTGYEYVEHLSYRIINPYLNIPRKGKGGRIKEDHILVLKNKK